MGSLMQAKKSKFDFTEAFYLRAFQVAATLTPTGSDFELLGLRTTIVRYTENEK